jgi:hypothetical protein
MAEPMQTGQYEIALSAGKRTSGDEIVKVAQSIK